MSHWDMALKVMDVVDQRLRIVHEVEAGHVSVVDAAAVYGVSRSTLHVWLARYRDRGADGVVPRSRRPLSSPVATAAELEDEIVRVHKDRNGRWGAKKIRAFLAGQGLMMPAVSTVHQILRRRGLIVDRPRRAGSVQSFCRQFPNDLWQIDGTAHRLVNGTQFWVADVIDDHSRFLLAAVVGSSLTGVLAWTAMRSAAAVGGLPRQLLSDNGLTFTGKPVGTPVFFEQQVAAAGIEFLHGRPRHPQTQGKIERQHQTQNQWLADHRPRSLAQAQEVLDAYREDYNHVRPHEALGQVVPARVYQPGEPVDLPVWDKPPADPFPPGALMRRISTGATFRYARLRLHLEERWAGMTLGLVRDHGRLHVYYGNLLITTIAVGDIPHPNH